ncbi:MAG: hypothetical protein M1834_006892 [Cirrosporium novae-zelandiae]|nr:MAG: hypothetical protein M1834_006892 [Cirrosporium novae-zelandiae]
MSNSHKQKYDKYADKYLFKKAEHFFQDLDNSGSGTQRPSIISYSDADQLDQNGMLSPVCSHGRVFRLNDGALILIQFIRPKVWRLQFNEENKKGADFTDYNTRTIVRDTLSNLVRVLDKLEHISWRVDLVQDNEFLILQSVRNPESPERQVITQLYIQRNPFKITAVQPLKVLPALEVLPQADATKNEELNTKAVQGTQNLIVWQTKEYPLAYNSSATVLSVEKPGRARYLGFGEQGGKHLFKDKVYMNYFNFDNMKYCNVYGKGPMDDREPLYHSEPFWLEVNAHPGYQSKVATFIDNYSQICVDFGVKDITEARIATRFNIFQLLVVAGDDIHETIHLYTSIVGRPALKPRYVLGYHQGCYGYDSKDKVLDVIKRYREEGYPIDGMHIDIDLQDDYRTFTIDTTRFPQPEDMFKRLRDQGVKCSTNITPFINSSPSDSYRTLNEGLKNDYFVKDKRLIDNPSNGTNNPSYQRYICYGEGSAYLKDPNAISDRPEYGDPYNFAENFNTGKPFHGGVSYGGKLGKPGVYPNLNDRKVRAWWGRQYEYLMETGLEFIWQDMTSPCVADCYGDMKSFPFRLLLSSDGWSGDPKGPSEKAAIEIWSLYSYNLHKATYQGLNELPVRAGKRNFIIGRGSFAGLHRYGGLWTGDNGSTWEFLNISVAQVLALGLSGVSIAGADVGGFMPAPHETSYADPELLIRWYCAYFLLPWFRNHYHGKPGMKKFQERPLIFNGEPYEYADLYESHKGNMSDHDRLMYSAVNPVCRYYIQLRYSLMQLLYDAMFENIINGLPIARALVLTDELDSSLFAERARFLQGQYMVRNDLLVAPVLKKESKTGTRRRLYLPRPDSWFQFNLRINGSLGVPLSRVPGGSTIDVYPRISTDESRIPYITPMYVREGGIIPQIQVRPYVPDHSRKFEEPNPITIHVYPGKDNCYDMYLDDGVSRESAPTNEIIHPYTVERNEAPHLFNLHIDKEAQGIFRHIQIRQQTTKTVPQPGHPNHLITRHITLKTLHAGYPLSHVKRDIGTTYKLVLWHEDRKAMDTSRLEFRGMGEGEKEAKWEKDFGARATVVEVMVDDVGEEGGVGILLRYLA